MSHSRPSDSLSGWTELANRGADGLEISLLWSRSTGQVKVTVADSRCDETFEVDVPGADALAAFYHPFTFTAGRFGVQVREATGLHLQV